MNSHYVATSLLVALDVSGSRVTATEPPRAQDHMPGDVVGFRVELDGKVYAVAVAAES